jgi:hypothetical protein
VSCPRLAGTVTRPPGAAEVCPTDPASCGGPGTGSATIEIDRNARTLCFAITSQNVALPLLAAHIHVAPAGQAGPVVVPLFTQAVNAATVPRTCLTGLDKNLLKAIIRNPQNYYVNVHNTPSPTARSGASWPDRSSPRTHRLPGSWDSGAPRQGGC